MSIPCCRLPQSTTWWHYVSVSGFKNAYETSLWCYSRISRRSRRQITRIHHPWMFTREVFTFRGKFSKLRWTISMHASTQGHKKGSRNRPMGEFPPLASTTSDTTSWSVCAVSQFENAHNISLWCCLRLQKRRKATRMTRLRQLWRQTRETQFDGGVGVPVVKRDFSNLSWKAYMCAARAVVHEMSVALLPWEDFCCELR
jgi:hypothetical protein